MTSFVFEDFSGFLFCLLCLNPEAEFCEEEERLSLSSGAREGGDKKLCNFDL